MIYNYLYKHLGANVFVMLLMLLFCTAIQAQSNYAFSVIPFQIYSANSPVQGTMDDTYSQPISLGFSFNYFNTNYSSVLVSTNGYLDFRTDLAGTGSPWNMTLPFPNPAFEVKNSILGCYHDLNNSNAEGTINYAIVGSAPYRKFVVIFNNNSQFSCLAAKSSFQMVLYETLDIIDVQIVDKQLCPTWNNGNAAVGLLNQTGTIAIMPTGRNTGAWTASNEGWRFQRPVDPTIYNYTVCDGNTDGFASFNLAVVQTAMLPAADSLVKFYPTLLDAQNSTAEITNLNYTNSTIFTQSIFADVNGTAIREVALRVVDCNQDYDLDGVPTIDEDLNGNGNLADDDTDGDGLPNFIDNDDDGDMVLTSVEVVFIGRNAQDTNVLPDTDGDGVPNYLDNDDDGDGVLTINEDYNGNNDPTDDDTNQNGVPDYLDQSVALGVTANNLSSKLITLFPNPTSDILNIQNNSNEKISSIEMYSVSGMLVKKATDFSETTTISVSDLHTGIYFVRIQISGQALNYKFIKR